MQFWEFKEKTWLKISAVLSKPGRNRSLEREWQDVNHLRQWHFYVARDSMTLTNAPSSLKIAEEPMWPDGTIFRLQRRRRNVSEERSFLWNFQPMRDEYSQPSPGSRLCKEHCINQPENVLEKSWAWLKMFYASSCVSLQRQLFDQISSSWVSLASSCGGRGTFSLLQPRTWVYHQGVWWFRTPSLLFKGSKEARDNCSDFQVK